MLKILEGDYLNTAENKAKLALLCKGETVSKGTYIEAKAGKSRDGKLYFKFGDNIGIMETSELSLLGQPKNAAFLVSKTVGFYVMGTEEKDGIITYKLSRKRVQKDYYEEVKKLKPMDIIQGKVSTVQQQAAYVDIGYGFITVVSIVNACISRTETLKDMFEAGELINIIVTKAVSEEDPFIYVSHKELLGTFEENVAQYSVGDVVMGKVSKITDYGIFVSLTSNLVTLVDLPEDEEEFPVSVGDFVSVTIKGINPEKTKVKARINITVPAQKNTGVLEKTYYLNYPYEDKGNRWIYNESSVDETRRVITEF